MGERSITTILRLKNESEYRAALKGCNQELRSLKSHLDLVSSEFRNNANSMEALTAKGSALQELYDAQSEKLATLRGALEKAQQTRERESQTVEDLRAKYAQAEDALAAFGDEVDESSETYQKAKQAKDELTNSLHAHQTKLASAEKSVSYYKEQINKATIELHDLSDRQAENSRLLEEAKASADGCATSIDRYGDAVREAADGTGSSASAVEALATTMVASGIQQEVEDLAATMMECAEASQTFELGLAKVYTLADESVLARADMSAGLLQISEDLNKNANDLLDAAYEALSAGVSTANVLDFVRQSTQLSVAGFTDAANAVDVLTTILNAYGLEASQTEAIASKLVKTQDLGKITVDELGQVMGRVIPSAAAYSVNLDNVAAAYAHMTSNGINAENTTTYLSTMLDELADSGSQVAGILREQTGMSFAELMVSGRSLGDVLGILDQSVNGNTTAFSNLWSSATGGRGALALLNSGIETFNATLDQMANASGAVAANYEKLADTSDYASRRVQISAQNLKIAVGDQLNPVLNLLRNASADIMDEASDIVSRNPAIVSAISGVVTAVGLLSTGISGLMIVKSVTAAMQAFNITLAANPAGLIAVAIAGLIAALATFAAQTESTREKINALTEASQNLSDTVTTGNQTYEESVASANAACSAVESYIDRLEELEATGLNTQAQQIEYQMVLDQINALMPELNASIDAQTNAVKGGTDALRAQAEQWKNTAIQEAAYTRYLADVRAMSDAKYELAKNEILKQNAERRGSEITSELAIETERLEQLTTQLDNARRRDGETVAEYELRYAGLSSAVSDQIDRVNSLKEAQTANAEETANYSEAIRIANETISQQQPLVDAATEAIAGYGEQITGSAELVAAGSEGMAQSMAGSLDQVSQKYQELRDSARESLETQFGLFEEAKVKSSLSVQDMTSNIQSQIDAFNNYADNITLAMERGIDQGLVLKLSDGTTESMGYLAELVTATDEEIAEINRLWLNLEEGTENATSAISEVTGAILGVIDAEAENAYDKGYSLGANTGDGAIAGLNSRKAAYAQAAAEFSAVSIDSYKRHSDQHSPSRKWQALGEMDTAGLLGAYKKAIPKMEAASKDISLSGYAAAIRARQNSMAHIAGALPGYSQPASADNSELISLLKQLLTAVKAGKILRVNGRDMVAATIDEHNAQMGQKLFLEERGC